MTHDDILNKYLSLSGDTLISEICHDIVGISNAGRKACKLLILTADTKNGMYSQQKLERITTIFERINLLTYFLAEQFDQNQEEEIHE